MTAEKLERLGVWFGEEEGVKREVTVAKLKYCCGFFSPRPSLCYLQRCHVELVLQQVSVSGGCCGGCSTRLSAGGPGRVWLGSNPRIIFLSP